MTDVLGTLVSWDDSTCVVAPESGPPVSIPVADVVTGKPVPARASVRQRISTRDAELHATPLWLEVSTQPVGDWVMRRVTGERGRGSRRANSCLAVGDPGLPVREATERVQAYYAGHGRVTTMQVEAGSDVEAELLALGWSEPEPEDAPYLVGSLVMALRSAGDPGDCRVDVDGTRILATVSTDVEQVARGRAEVNGDWLGIHGLHVDEDRRRGGLGRQVMAALLEAGAELGASTVWLEVDRSNTPAWMMYAGLGLREHHRCRYLAAPG
jgi:ribosomal protein S18 acetylase RimI-like enzyme